MRRYVPELAAAVITPALFFLYAAMRGWSVGWGEFGVGALVFHVELALLVAIGAVAAVVGWRRDLRLTPLLVPVGIVVATLVPMFQPDPGLRDPVGELRQPLAFLVILGVIAVAIEYAVRNRQRSRRFYTRRSLQTGLAVGTLPLVLLLLAQPVYGNLSHFVTDVVIGTFVRTPVLAVVITLWFVPGIVLLFGLPAALLVHPRLLSPALVVYGLLVWSLVVSFQSPGAVPAILILVSGWFIPLGIGLLVGAGESTLRKRYRRGRNGGKPSGPAEG